MWDIPWCAQCLSLHLPNACIRLQYQVMGVFEIGAEVMVAVVRGANGVEIWDQFFHFMVSDIVFSLENFQRTRMNLEDRLQIRPDGYKSFCLVLSFWFRDCRTWASL